MSIVDSKIWRTVAPHIQVQKYLREGGAKNARFRLEIKPTLIEADLFRCLAASVKCAACGDRIHPIRKRTNGKAYLAVTCPLEVKIACSRGRAASAEYKHIAESLNQ